MQSKKHIFNIYMSWVLIFGQLVHYIQAYKIFYTKSAEDISLTAYIICLILLIHWFVYGLIKKDKVIIIAEIFGACGAILVIIGTIMYS